MAALFLCSLTQSFGVPDGVDPKLPRPVRTMVDGHKVYAYGEFDVYEVSPAYDEALIVQKGNANPWRKIRPKKSWEIKSNFLGLTPTRSPSFYAAELEPHAAPFFVDGNPATVGFAGRPLGNPTVARAWLRIDFPRPVKISSVALVSRPDGKGMPASFTVRTYLWDLWQTVSPDRKEWYAVVSVEDGVHQPVPRPRNTAPNVYKPEQSSGSSGAKRVAYRFDPILAREVWLTSPDDFYLAEFEVHDETGANIALISRGCGATVSCEQYLFWLSEQTQASLWQMHYDLGIKWIRENYYLTPLIWRYVERERGIYRVDPYFDYLITQSRDCGIELCLTLGGPDNPCYGEGESPEAFANYCRFMVKHFKGRVRYYEILNEYYNQDSFGKGKQGPVEASADRYVRLALPAARAIKDADPDAKIILCGPCPLVADWILSCLKKGMVKHADVLSWHPYSFPKDTDEDYPPEELDRPRSVWAPAEVKTYADSVNYLRREAAKLGFRGTLMANEAGAYAIHADRTSNLIAAKYLARSAVLHTALGVPMFWNETTSLMRPSWQQFFRPGAPDLKPAQSYYILRTLCTLLDGAQVEGLRFQPVTPVDRIEKYGFSLPGGAKLLALWVRERSRKHRFDDYEGIGIDLEISTRQPRRIAGIDLLNGREQDLAFTSENGRIIVPNLVLRDYPLMLRIER